MTERSWSRSVTGSSTCHRPRRIRKAKNFDIYVSNNRCAEAVLCHDAVNTVDNRGRRAAPGLPPTANNVLYRKRTIIGRFRRRTATGWAQFTVIRKNRELPDDTTTRRSADEDITCKARSRDLGPVPFDQLGGSGRADR